MCLKNALISVEELERELLDFHSTPIDRDVNVNLKGTRCH